MTRLPAPLRLLTAIGCVAAIASSSGCGGVAASDPSGGVVVVVGARSNMPPVSLDGVSLQETRNAADTHSPISLVVADGAPFVAERLPPAASGSGDARSHGTVGGRAALQQALDGALARSPESDLLGALAVAAQEVAPSPGRHTIVVVDSGLSTAGSVDFRQPGLLDADPADLVASLRSDGALPNLEGVRVVFQGLGDTAAPQAPLDSAVREQLVDLWTEIARGAGAIEVALEATPLSGIPHRPLPPVSVVGPADAVSCTDDTVVLHGGDVAFRPDTALFQDPAAATQTLRPIAESMAAAGVTATLTGTTADVGSGEGQRELGERRARAVADLLAELGVPSGRMAVVGLGSGFPGYVEDHDAAGNLLPAAAALNRRVVVELSGSGSPVICS